MEELKDFRKRCTIEDGSLIEIDATGLYTVEQGEYIDGNIALFRPEPDSSLRCLLDRKSVRVWNLSSGYTKPLRDRPVFHLCRYLSAVYGQDPEKERQKAEALTVAL